MGLLPDPITIKVISEQETNSCLVHRSARVSSWRTSELYPASAFVFNPKFNTKTSVSLFTDSSSFIKSTSKPQISSSTRRTSRLPEELSALMTMMPLHTAIASSCLKSGLLMESQSWGLVPQGISMPL
ncbi:hypothetical protein L1987_31060 [Smallanthus sonchifolius]|uniref:Uncharacterized protein n=1 Tax=Smallanthus sonchifolius TaxID=185202 RepID=A0ACB9I3W2_9ASTR|nr:hypothetical protein L1987_31060 [Smallanthus sonchifolius]